MLPINTWNNNIYIFSNLHFKEQRPEIGKPIIQTIEVINFSITKDFELIEMKSICEM